MKVAPVTQGEIVCASFAYKPRIYRMPHVDVAKHVTHRLTIALDDEGNVLVLPKKGWQTCSVNAKMTSEFSKRYPLVYTCFAKITPAFDNAPLDDEWKPQLRKVIAPGNDTSAMITRIEKPEKSEFAIHMFRQLYRFRPRPLQTIQC